MKTPPGRKTKQSLLSSHVYSLLPAFLAALYWIELNLSLHALGLRALTCECRVPACSCVNFNPVCRCTMNCNPIRHSTLNPVLLRVTRDLIHTGFNHPPLNHTHITEHAHTFMHAHKYQTPHTSTQKAHI